jgi:aryl-alcohol dehydrogenase-like predicted oxidoreductase
MKYVRLGRTGLEVSRVCLGCMSFGNATEGAHPWTLDEEASRPFIRRAAPIVGATRPEHIDDAVSAVDVVLTREEVALLEAPYTPHPIVGFQ